jgi:hypothetical protein
MKLKRVSELDPYYRREIIKHIDSGRMTFDEAAERYGVSELDVKKYYRDHKRSLEKTTTLLCTWGHF